MNALQKYIQTINERSYGFLLDSDMPTLIALDRLCQVLVRCGGCRFLCAAQDVSHLESCIKAGGDYVRDVSFPVGAMDRAASYVPEQFRSERPCPELANCQTTAITMGKGPVASRNQTLSDWYRSQFNENDCGGAFDGNQVTSDADSSL